MKVLLLPSYFLPEGISSPYISWNRNQAFVEEGWDVVVYTPVPCRGISDDVRKEYKHKKLEMMLDGKMTVHRFSKSLHIKRTNSDFCIGNSDATSDYPL